MNIEDAITQITQKWRLGNHEEALADMQKVINEETLSASHYLMRAQMYRKIEEFDKSISDYTMAISLDSSDVVTLLERSTVYTYIEEYEKALEDINRAIEVEPNYSYYARRANILIQKGDFEQEIVDLDMVLSKVNHKVQYYRQRATAYIELGKLQMAVKDYRKVMEILPETHQEYNATKLLIQRIEAEKQ